MLSQVQLAMGSGVGQGETNIIGNENVTPSGISSGSSFPQRNWPSRTTSAMQKPIQANKSSALLCFSCSPIGHDFSRWRRTRDRGGVSF
jgi:hypothetical protein